MKSQYDDENLRRIEEFIGFIDSSENKGTKVSVISWNQYWKRIDHCVNNTQSDADERHKTKLSFPLRISQWKNDRQLPMTKILLDKKESVDGFLCLLC